MCLHPRRMRMHACAYHTAPCARSAVQHCPSVTVTHAQGGADQSCESKFYIGPKNMRSPLQTGTASPLPSKTPSTSTSSCGRFCACAQAHAHGLSWHSTCASTARACQQAMVCWLHPLGCWTPWRHATAQSQCLLQAGCMARWRVVHALCRWKPVSRGCMLGSCEAARSVAMM